MMKTIPTIFCILISVTSYTQIEDYTVIFDQILLSLNNISKEELVEKSEVYLKQIEGLWPNVKNRLYSEIDWNKNQNSIVRDIDIKVNILKRSIEIHNAEYTAALSFKILSIFQKLRYDRDNKDYPIDLLLSLSSRYTEINKTVYDQKLDLYEWMEFQEMVDKFISDWENYNCLSIEDISNSFPNLDKKKHEMSKGKFIMCLEDFINSLESGYRSDFELPCSELGNALDTLTTLYHFDILTIKGL